MRPRILGVDFDDTLFLHSYPSDYSSPNWPIIEHVKQRKKSGWYVILVTCRSKPQLIQEAIDACKNVGIVFDAVNENHPMLIAEYGDCRKISCDEYIDNKNLSIREVIRYDAFKER